MATANTDALKPGLKPCPVCAEPINGAASKCIHCGSELGGLMRRLGMSASILSLLIALFAVIAAAVPAVRYLVTPMDSALAFSPQGANKNRIFILASNSGIRPGSVRAGALTATSPAGQSQMVMHIDGLEPNEPRAIAPGGSVLIKLYSNSGIAAGARDGCRLTLYATSFRGESSSTTIAFHCEDLQPFFSEHPARE
jgi:hypothetical protein